MRSLSQYIKEEGAATGGGVMTTPGQVTGMGDPSLPGDGITGPSDKAGSEPLEARRRKKKCCKEKSIEEGLLSRGGREGSREAMDELKKQAVGDALSGYSLISTRINPENGLVDIRSNKNYIGFSTEDWNKIYMILGEVSNSIREISIVEGKADTVGESSVKLGEWLSSMGDHLQMVSFYNSSTIEGMKISRNPKAYPEFTLAIGDRGPLAYFRECTFDMGGYSKFIVKYQVFYKPLPELLEQTLDRCRAENLPKGLPFVMIESGCNLIGRELMEEIYKRHHERCQRLSPETSVIDEDQWILSSSGKPATEPLPSDLTRMYDHVFEGSDILIRIRVDRALDLNMRAIDRNMYDWTNEYRHTELRGSHSTIYPSVFRRDGKYYFIYLPQKLTKI